MLDLLTLGLSMGAQEELNKAREAHGAELNQDSSCASTMSTPTILGQAADVLDSMLNAVEDAAGRVVESMTPTPAMVGGAVAAVQPLTLDLSLPTAAPACKN